MASQWVVMTGYYSDRNVECVAPDEATASAIVAAANSDGRGEWHCQEVPVRSTAPETIGAVSLHATIEASGEVTEETEHTYSHVGWFTDDGDQPDAYDLDRPPVPLRWEVTLWGVPLTLRLRVWGSDVERVRKRYSELRAQIAAQPEVWLERAKWHGSAQPVGGDD